VGVIASRVDLLTAIRSQNPPDLFELRLDQLIHALDFVETKLSILLAKKRTGGGNRTKIIITARHPREGGANNLSAKRRQELLSCFLPHADYIDIELRSAKRFKLLLTRARKRNVIISFHDFESTPSLASLRAKAHKAKSLGADIFKVATWTDSKTDLARLLEFFHDPKVDLPISAMGIGKLGSQSRRELLRLGSVLNYAAIARARLAGQPSLSAIRRWALDVER
jgi:3-dehydroquinate dehydratase-1